MKKLVEESFIEEVLKEKLPGSGWIIKLPNSICSQTANLERFGTPCERFIHRDGDMPVTIAAILNAEVVPTYGIKMRGHFPQESGAFCLRCSQSVLIALENKECPEAQKEALTRLLIAQNETLVEKSKQIENKFRS